MPGPKSRTVNNTLPSVSSRLAISISLRSAPAENLSALSTRLIRICVNASASSASSVPAGAPSRTVSLNPARSACVAHFERTMSSSSALATRFTSSCWLLRVSRASCSTFSMSRESRSLSLWM